MSGRKKGRTGKRGNYEESRERRGGKNHVKRWKRQDEIEERKWTGKGRKCVLPLYILQYNY